LSIGVLPFAFSPAVWPCKDYLYHSPTSYVDSKGGGCGSCCQSIVS
jgi:hypothetical protein